MKRDDKINTALLILPSRLILFLVFQLLLALVLSSFGDSIKLWIASASATNIVSILLLIFLLRKDGLQLLDLFRIERTTLKKDILQFLGIALICGPVVLIPNYFLSIWLWGDAQIPYNMMFKPLPLQLVYVLLIIFPVTIAFAELATYFAYIMPVLLARFKKKWLAVLFPVLFLSLQHATLPFIPDLKFVIYRILMYLPFASLIGIILYYKPKFFPFFAIMHGLLDFATVMVLLKASAM